MDRDIQQHLRESQEKGLISQVPSFNSVLNYQRDPEVTKLLTSLVELSALPLAAIESDFAVDSSGFGTKCVKTGYSIKHGKEMSSRDWRTAHLMAGVRTHIVTAVTVTPSTANDAPDRSELAKTTAKGFDMNEISGDKGYLSRANADEIEGLGATPFIPFKSNSIEPVPGSAWARMYHQFAFNRDEFLDHYHKRSNVETVFAMIKAKFGDILPAKTPDGQDNDVLAKVVAHNLCVLIQSFDELGIEVDLRRPRSSSFDWSSRSTTDPPREAGV